MTPDWTLITVTYNSTRHLKAWWSGPRDPRVRWLVVDNGSSDGSAETARALGADVIPLACNIGFSRANNVGLRSARTPWVAFVNPDVEVGTESLDRLADVADRECALVTPQLVDGHGTPQGNGRGLPFLVDKLANRGVVLPGARLASYVPSVEAGPTYVGWTIGAAVAGRRTHFEALGGWAEEFFLYYEDHDLGLRAWRGGHPVVVVPDVRWTHDWQRATTRAALGPWRREVGSAWRFFRRYPEFLLPTRRLAAARHPEAARMSGRTVTDG